MKSFVTVQSLSRVWLCDPMDCSMLGFPVLHCLPRFAQTHVHWVDDAVQSVRFLLSGDLRNWYSWRQGTQDSQLGVRPVRSCAWSQHSIPSAILSWSKQSEGPLLDSRRGDVDLLGEWQDHIAEDHQMQERWLQPFQNTVDHTSFTISLAIPVCSYSKRQSASGLILYMEQLPNINSLMTPDIFKVSHKQI